MYYLILKSGPIVIVVCEHSCRFWRWTLFHISDQTLLRRIRLYYYFKFEINDGVLNLINDSEWNSFGKKIYWKFKSVMLFESRYLITFVFDKWLQKYCQLFHCNCWYLALLNVYLHSYPSTKFSVSKTITYILYKFHNIFVYCFELFTSKV